MLLSPLSRRRVVGAAWTRRRLVAGQADFTPDEWMTMRRAMISAGVLVSLSEGGGADMLDEIFAILQRLRGTRIQGDNQLLRELADIPSFESGLRPGMKVAEYEGSALDLIRSAVAAVQARSPSDLAAFRAFLVELAEVAANAHKEGGVAGMGGVRVTRAEAAAISRVKRAAGAA
jgi:hypothetical protein